MTVCRCRAVVHGAGKTLDLGLLQVVALIIHKLNVSVAPQNVCCRVLVMASAHQLERIACHGCAYNININLFQTSQYAIAKKNCECFCDAHLDFLPISSESHSCAVHRGGKQQGRVQRGPSNLHTGHTRRVA